jgi:hypothetical protein
VVGWRGQPHVVFAGSHAGVLISLNIEVHSMHLVTLAENSLPAEVRYVVLPQGRSVCFSWVGWSFLGEPPRFSCLNPTFQSQDHF